jgi:hypothetical protein
MPDLRKYTSFLMEVLPNNPKYWPSAQLLLFGTLSQLPVLSSIWSSVIFAGRQLELKAIFLGIFFALIPTYSVYLIWALGLGWVVGPTLLDRVLYYMKFVWGGTKWVIKNIWFGAGWAFQQLRLYLEIRDLPQ